MKLVVNWPGRAAETLDWPTNFTTGEMRLIKHVTGLRPSEMVDAFDADDPDIFVAYASVAVRRAHPELSTKQIAADLDALEFDGGLDVVIEPEDGQSPPAEAGDPAGPEPPSPDANSTTSTPETPETDGT